MRHYVSRCTAGSECRRFRCRSRRCSIPCDQLTYTTSVIIYSSSNDGELCRAGQGIRLLARMPSIPPGGAVEPRMHRNYRNPASVIPSSKAPYCPNIVSPAPITVGLVYIRIARTTVTYAVKHHNLVGLNSIEDIFPFPLWPLIDHHVIPVPKIPGRLSRVAGVALPHGRTPNPN